MLKWITICTAAMLLPCLSGCGAKTTATEKSPASKSDGHAHEEHAHKGSHGGEMIALDGEKAHIELVHRAAEGAAVGGRWMEGDELREACREFLARHKN